MSAMIAAARWEIACGSPEIGSFRSPRKVDALPIATRLPAVPGGTRQGLGRKPLLLDRPGDYLVRWAFGRHRSRGDAVLTPAWRDWPTGGPRPRRTVGQDTGAQMPVLAGRPSPGDPFMAYGPQLRHRGAQSARPFAPRSTALTRFRRRRACGRPSPQCGPGPPRSRPFPSRGWFRS